MNDVKEIPIHLLKDNCCKQDQQENTHEPYCFELFRRAINRSNQRAWDAIHETYNRLVFSWVQRSNPLVSAQFDDLVQDAWLYFYRYFGIDQLSNAPSLGAILRYLKSCTHTAVMQYNRKYTHESLDSDLPEQYADKEDGTNVEKIVNDKIQGEELWQELLTLCSNETECLLLECYFVYDLKPRQIVRRYPKMFANENEVNVIRRRMFKRIRKHPAFYLKSEG